MMNHTSLVGRLTKDPEFDYTKSGVARARFTLAVNRPFKNKDGEQEADFISCIAWRKTAENLANFMTKGQLIGVEGRIETGSYDKNGTRIYTTTVVADTVQFLEPKVVSSPETDRKNNRVTSRKEKVMSEDLPF